MKKPKYNEKILIVVNEKNKLTAEEWLSDNQLLNGNADMRREYGHEKRVEQYFQGLRENNPTAISTGPISSGD